MTAAEWALLVAVGAHAAAMVAAIVRLVAWASSTHARIEARLNSIEGKVDNDIAGRRIVSEMKSDVAVIKATMTDLNHTLSARQSLDDRKQQIVFLEKQIELVGATVARAFSGCPESDGLGSRGAVELIH